MFFRPLGQACFPVVVGEAPVPMPNAEPLPETKEGDAIVALLDGPPLEHHALLDGRLLIDDPDSLANKFQPAQQHHGTAMASLIIHGDRNVPEPALPRAIYVRPVLVPKTSFNNEAQEVTPEDRLLVDLIHQSVRRIFEGDASIEPVAPSVKVINLSIGNSFQPFDRDMTPFARLLDWLAWKYNVLFIISVGNHPDSITIDAKVKELGSLKNEAWIALTLKAMWNNQFVRRPLSPSESVNAITVGAVHADGSAAQPVGKQIDLLKGTRLPAPYGTVASGFRRSVKPEILLPGGRQFYHPPMVESNSAATFTSVATNNPPGQLVASPGTMPMELNRLVCSRGTSNATALGTRAAAMIHDRLLALRQEPGGNDLTDEFLVVLMKALLVHGASWGPACVAITSAFPKEAEDWRKLQRLHARFLGFGEANTERGMLSTEQRATVIGWGKLKADEAHEFQLPLPPCLSANREQRRLTATLAWLTPCNPRHKDYRKASLWFTLPEDNIGTTKKDLDFDSGRRGTVQHRIFEGQRAKAFTDGAVLPIKVNCFEDAGDLSEEIRYGIVVTLEVSEALTLPVYQEIRQRIISKIQIKT
jgi:hypothetical protein